MESPTRYDLTAALAGWRAELAAPTQLTTEARRELESHLLDAIAGYRQRGLTDDEAFWLGRRQLGQPEQLAAEFTKAHPAAIWRERVFWIALAMLVNSLWGHLVSGACRIIIGTKLQLGSHLRNILPDWVAYYLPRWMQDMEWISLFYWLANLLVWVPLLVLAITLAKGGLKTGRIVWNFVFQSRRRFILIGLAMLAAESLILYFNFWFGTAQGRTLDPIYLYAIGMLAYSLWDLVLIALIAWLMPAPRPRQLKTA